MVMAGEDREKDEAFEFFTGFPPMSEAKQAVPVCKSHIGNEQTTVIAQEETVAITPTSESRVEIRRSYGYRQGICPFCETEQDFELADEDNFHSFATFLYAMRKPHKFMFNILNSFWQVVVRDIASTPMLKCTFCGRTFFQCPYCHTTVELPHANEWSQMNCSNCHQQLDVCGNWG
jgi:hypothetical protein